MRRTRRQRLARLLALLALLAPSAGRAQPATIAPPALVRNAEPAFPPARQAEGVGADVGLELVLDPDGRVRDARVTSSGGDDFDAAALEAARRLEFTPARRDGRPVAAKIPFTFHFAIAPPPPPPAAARLRVLVRTPADDPLPLAAVRATPSDGVAREGSADAAGALAFEGLPPGAIRLRVESPGFEPFGGEETLAPGTGADLVVRLRPAATPAEVVVRGDRPAREVTRYTLDADEARKTPGTRGDALRALENLPGVARPSVQNAALIVRGAAPRDTQVFVDGTAVPIIYHFGGLSSVVPAEALGRLDFIPGNYGPEYGRALGGVVDVGLKSPRRDRLGALVQADLVDARAFVEGPVGGRVRFLAGARRSWLDAWIGPVLEQNGNGVRTAPVYYDGQALVEADLGAATTARVAFFGSGDRLRLVLNAPDPSDPVPGDINVRTEFWRVQARLETRLGGDRLRLTNTLSYGEDVRDLQIGRQSLRLRTRPLDYRADARARLARGVAAIAGVDLRQASVDADVRLLPQDGPTDAPSPSFGRPPAVLRQGASTYDPAAYAALELRPRPDVRLLPAARVDWSRATGRWDVAPRLTARWDARRAFPRTAFKGGIGLYYQPPEPFEAIPPYGTAGLRSGRSVHQSVGVEQALARALEVSVEGFYKRLDGLVVRSPAGPTSPSGVAYANDGSGRTFGLEALARWRGERLTGWLAYTLSRSERRERDGAPLRPFEFDQTHILTALASYKLGRGWEAGARFRLVSGNPYTPYAGGVADLDAGAYGAVPGRPFGARLPPFHQLDVRVEKAWAIGEGKVTLYLDVQNVYNRQNPEGVQYNYNYTRQEVRSGLPLLPAVGVRGEL